MKLGLKDRIILPNIFPKEGSFEDLIIIGDIKKKLAITQKEIVDFEIKSELASIIWNEKGVKKEFDMEFSEIEIKTISDVFKKMSDEKKLTSDYIELYKLFVK